MKLKLFQHRDEFPEENPSISKLGLDEAQPLSGSVKGFDDGGVKRICEFLFAAAEKTGHKISSGKPTFFELEDRTDFQKVVSLITIFEER